MKDLINEKLHLKDTIKIVDDVIVLEKLAQTGGSTALSGGGISATGTKFQEELGIEDMIILRLLTAKIGGKVILNRGIIAVWTVWLPMCQIYL